MKNTNFPNVAFPNNSVWQEDNLAVYYQGDLIFSRRGHFYFDVVRIRDGILYIRYAAISTPNSPYFLDFFHGLILHSLTEGHSRIYLNAARNKTEYGDIVGYYAFARLGCEFLMRTDAERLFLESGKVSLQELLSTKDGRDWWRENGWTAEMKFELKDESVHRFLEYKKSRIMQIVG